MGVIAEDRVEKKINYKLGDTIPEKVINNLIARYVLEYKVDGSIINKIIKCESSNNPYATNTNYKDGIAWSKDFGLMQINDYYHKDTMSKLGLNIENPQDSLKYGFILFKSQGTTPWSASKKCWSK